jgi:hypothetical protein
MNFEQPTENSPESETELSSLAETLKQRGIDPEKVETALNAFMEIQKKLHDSMQEYNTATESLAQSMGEKVNDDQIMKFPANMKLPDGDLRKYLRMSRASQKGAESNFSSKELPPELL